MIAPTFLPSHLNFFVRLRGRLSTSFRTIHNSNTAWSMKGHHLLQY